MLVNRFIASLFWLRAFMTIDNFTQNQVHLLKLMVGKMGTY